LRFDEPPFDVTAPNITPDKETGIGNWTDAQIKTMLLTGKNPHGIQEAEVMPTAFYPILTPGDLDGIVAYLRSLTPVKNKVADPVYKIALPHHVFPGAEKSYSQADLNDKLKRGFYLVTIGHCMECHTPFAPPGGPDFANSLGKGGREFPGPWGVSKSRNITSHKTAGIGDWTDAEIKTAITQGKRKDGTPLKGPMGYQYYAKMTDADLDAVIAYSADAAAEGIGPFSAPALAPGQGMAGPRALQLPQRGAYISVPSTWDRHAMPYRLRLLSAALAAVSLLLPQGAGRRTAWCRLRPRRCGCPTRRSSSAWCRRSSRCPPPRLWRTAIR
jgi:mono/diheme cytochrome c family protein